MKSVPLFPAADWPHLLLLVLAPLTPLGLALLLRLLFVGAPVLGDYTVLQPVTLASASRLEALFESVDYSWPPRQQVPALEVRRIPADMAELEISRKKTLFLRALLPMVLAENARLRNERRWLDEMTSNARLSSQAQYQRLLQMAEEYGLGEKPVDTVTLISRLRERVDEVPIGLVLAQAANESGWGTSRFSREVNNLFGEWTYKESQGVLPRHRKEGASHFVRSFSDLRSSVRSYLLNINSNRAYSPLRALRAQLRREGRELDPLLLAEGLIRYSARGEEYVAEIRAMIRKDGLNALGPLRLVHSATAG